MNFDKTIAAQKYVNILGALFGGGNDTRQTNVFAAEIRAKHPYNEKYSCHDLAVLIGTVDRDISGRMLQKAGNDSKANQTTQNSYITAATEYKNELQSRYMQLRCQQAEDAERDQQFFDTQFTQLARVKGLATPTNSNEKYLIYAMLGFVVAVTVVIILKPKS